MVSRRIDSQSRLDSLTRSSRSRLRLLSRSVATTQGYDGRRKIPTCWDCPIGWFALEFAERRTKARSLWDYSPAEASCTTRRIACWAESTRQISSVRPSSGGVQPRCAQAPAPAIALSTARRGSSSSERQERFGEQYCVSHRSSRPDAVTAPHRRAPDDATLRQRGSAHDPVGKRGNWGSLQSQTRENER